MNILPLAYLCVCLCLEQEMDGAAFGLGSSSGPNWLQDEIPKVGLRLKVHHALVQLCNECQVKKWQTVHFLLDLFFFWKSLSDKCINSI